MRLSEYEAKLLARQRAHEGVRRAQRARAMCPRESGAPGEDRTGDGAGFARLMLALRSLVTGAERGPMARVTRPREASPRA